MELEPHRLAIIEEARTWLGTPFVNCADVKGRQGGVDCAMLLVRCYVDTGVLSPFDPRPYPPQWHVHHDRERFLEWVVGKLGGAEVSRPRPGDVAVYHWGRCFSHGAIVISDAQVIHSFFKDGCCTVANMSDTDFTYLRNGKPRPVKFFEVTRK